MSDWLKLVLSGTVILITNAIEGVTGFGSTVIALPFLNFTIGLHDAVQVLCFFGWLVPIYIVSRSWKHIKWNELGRILLYCAPGVPIGMFLFDALPSEILCAILGLFMIYVSISGWQGMKCTTCMPVPAVAKKSKLLKLFLFCGGIIQGAFGTGGPFIVIYATKALPDKSLFRVTLSLLWLTINSSRMAIWAVKGELSNPHLWKLILICLPFWAAGILLGDYLHHRVSERNFKYGVYALLGISGVVMLANNLYKLGLF
ncbi:MAG: sulfite exporter TauE/SafE family protein [Lentisphaeria bacterium]|nr:sulfite exporter TauE/SafE family protein [Lentisphaeria bacterium]MBQ7397148.1 sulfite exporter TauE/SafE family protein [Lentisphaeria bacterium]